MAHHKGAHHRGGYQRAAKRVTTAAYLDRTTTCWQCSRTLEEVHRLHPDAIWTAGHVIDGQVNGELRAECSPCNYGRGASAGNLQRLGKPMFRTSRKW